MRLRKRALRTPLYNLYCAGENSIPPLHCRYFAAILNLPSLILYSSFATVYARPFPSIIPRSIDLQRSEASSSSSTVPRAILTNNWPSGSLIEGSSSAPEPLNSGSKTGAPRDEAQLKLHCPPNDFQPCPHHHRQRRYRRPYPRYLRYGSLSTTVPTGSPNEWLA